jgi:serine/threonine-protein kinase
VHRDISPHNVLVGVDGITKLTDFGIAKAESRVTTTRDGQLKGKLAYMAPEQARSEKLDRRADVFALGIVAWEMLAGQRLFPGDSNAAILAAVLFARIPAPRDVTPEVPDDVSAVVRKALEREPSARWGTAAEFAEALERAAAPGSIAPARTVAGYVQQVSAEKLEQERALLRGASSPVNPANAGLSQDPTIVDAGGPPPETTASPSVNDLSRANATRLRGAPLYALVTGVSAVAAVLMLSRSHAVPPPASAPVSAQAPPPPAPSSPPDEARDAAVASAGSSTPPVATRPAPLPKRALPKHTDSNAPGSDLLPVNPYRH